MSAKIADRPVLFFQEESSDGFFLIQREPTVVKTTCVSARSTISTGKPPIKNPSVVPSATAMPTAGEMNMAIKTATWLATVKEAGGMTILSGEIMGIRMPTAVRSPAMTIFKMVLCMLF